MNEIVNQHNDLIDLPLRKFNASEIDILQAICYKCQNQGTKEVVFKFDDIRQLADYGAKDDDRFYKAIESTGDKLFSLNIKIGTDREFEKFVLFPTYKVSEKEQSLTVSVNEKFAYMLNELSGNYTALELQEASSLKSAYSKSIYRKLRKFRTTGRWTVNLDDFRTYLDIPNGYTQHNIDQRVIEPALAELSSYFQGLKCSKSYEKNRKGKGRPRVIGYEWTFKPAVREKKPAAEPSQKSIADITGWVKTGKYCPHCHRPIYKKQFENENGVYWMYGHADWKTGQCSFKTFDIADLLEEYQLPKADPPTEEQQENKRRLGNLLGNLFK